MSNTLFLISRIREAGNNLIISRLKALGLFGLAPSHGDILAFLYKNGPSTMKNIAEKIHRTKATVTVLIDKLEKLGLVKREPSPTDSRAVNIVLTDKGCGLKPAFEEISKELNEFLYRNLTDREVEQLNALLAKIVK